MSGSRASLCGEIENNLSWKLFSTLSRFNCVCATEIMNLINGHKLRGLDFIVSHIYFYTVLLISFQILNRDDKSKLGRSWFQKSRDRNFLIYQTGYDYNPSKKKCIPVLFICIFLIVSVLFVFFICIIAVTLMHFIIVQAVSFCFFLN